LEEFVEVRMGLDDSDDWEAEILEYCSVLGWSAVAEYILA
jgi:hypothetical protein